MGNIKYRRRLYPYKPRYLAVPSSPQTQLTNNRIAVGGVLNSQNVSSLKESWRFATPAPVTSRPLLANGLLYFTDWAGNAYSVRPADGSLVWRLQLTDVVQDGEPAGLFATGTIAGDSWFVASVGQDDAPGRIFMINLSNQTPAWSSPASMCATSGVYSHPLVFQGFVIAGVAARDNCSGAMVSKNTADGTTVWESLTSTLLPDSRFSDSGGIIQNIAIDAPSQTALFVTGDAVDGVSQNTAAAIDVNFGTPIWQVQLPALPGCGPQLFPLEADRRVWMASGVGGQNGQYWAMDRVTGTRLWNAQVSQSDNPGLGISAQASIADGIYVTSNEGYDGTANAGAAVTVAKLNRSDGSKEWSVRGAAGIYKSSGILSNDVYITGDMRGNIIAYRSSDGDVLAQFNIVDTSVASDLAVFGNQLVFGCGLPETLDGHDGFLGVIAYTAT